MKRLYDEILRRFPEIETDVHSGDEAFPYLMISYIVNWLRTEAKPQFDPEIIQRVVDFDRWCMEQPSGNTANDDIPAIVVVAMHEKFFKYDELLPLVPSVMLKEEVLKNGRYLSDWVGPERYMAGLRMFDAKPQDARKKPET